MLLTIYLHYEKRNNKKVTDYYIGVGLCIDAVFGVLYDNVGLGIPLGLIFGVDWQQ